MIKVGEDWVMYEDTTRIKIGQRYVVFDAEPNNTWSDVIVVERDTILRLADKIREDERGQTS
jgi:hypothetical protein